MLGLVMLFNLIIVRALSWDTYLHGQGLSCSYHCFLRTIICLYHVHMIYQFELKDYPHTCYLYHRGMQKIP